MIFPIEVKVNIDGEVDNALSALVPSPAEKSERQIWFAEDHDGVEDGRLPLLNGGVIIRFRSGDGPDDLTAKLRPCDESQLVGRWSGPFEVGSLEYRIEGDWSGKRRVLAASAVDDRPPGALLGAVQPDIDAAEALSQVQRQFIEQCARPGVHVDRLDALGPIASQKWSDVQLGDLEVNVERWTVVRHVSQAAIIRKTRHFQDHGEFPPDCTPEQDRLDFLEVSIRVKPKDDESQDAFESRVERKQQELEEAVRDRGVVISEYRDNTQRVLTALAAAARSG